MSFQAVKGTRDFYPAQMRLRNWIADAWRRVSLRNGFEEYDAPIFEYLDLFTVKSGQEIAGQLFSFTDRGGRNLAIRPEITPSLARMVNAKINSLPRPIKWFSIPRLCRAENPQKGRLREFFQWNIDIIGSDDVLADAECIFTAVDFLREIGLTSDDVQVRIGSRALASSFLRSQGVAEESLEKVLAVLDKRSRLSEQEFAKLAGQVGLNAQQIEEICKFLDVTDTEAVQQLAGNYLGGNEKEVASIVALWECLENFGILDYCRWDPSIVRGLAYYTGIVYEIFDASKSLRAVGGGGRYDNLLKLVGGPNVPATGFGIGDVVLGILLEEKGKIPPEIMLQRLDFFVIDAGDGLLEKVIEVVGALRSKGASADFSYKRQSIAKQLKQANRRGARRAVIVRDVREDRVAVKDMATGEQKDVLISELHRRRAGDC